jgi:hypothetical protein
MSSIVAPKSRGSFALWFATLAPPLLWITQIALAGELTEVACAPGFQPNNLFGLGIRTFLVIASVVLALPVAAAAVVSYFNLRALAAIRNRNPREERGRFMALLGLVGSLYFLVWMVVAAVAIPLLGLCQR